MICTRLNDLYYVERSVQRVEWFIITNHTISLKKTHLFFAQFLGYLILVLDDNMNEEWE